MTPEQTSGWSRSELYIVKKLEDHGDALKEMRSHFDNKFDAFKDSVNNEFKRVDRDIAGVQVEAAKKGVIAGFVTSVLGLAGAFFASK